MVSGSRSASRTGLGTRGSFGHAVLFLLCRPLWPSRSHPCTALHCPCDLPRRRRSHATSFSGRRQVHCTSRSTLLRGCRCLSMSVWPPYIGPLSVCKCCSSPIVCQTLRRGCCRAVPPWLVVC